MHPEKIESLFQEYPDLFHKKLLTNGFECQDGWFELLQRSAGRIADYLSGVPSPEKCVVVQVSQKMGGLRIGVHGGDIGLQDLVRDIELESLTICELDGKPACGLYVLAPNWFRCLCKNCSELHGYMKIEDYLCGDSITISGDYQFHQAM